MGSEESIEDDAEKKREKKKGRERKRRCEQKREEIERREMRQSGRITWAMSGGRQDEIGKKRPGGRK